MDRPGRASKSVTLDQAVAVLRAAEGSRWYAYLVLSIVTGARTEELRSLTWDQIDTADEVPTIHVWTSVRGDGATKTDAHAGPWSCRPSRSQRSMPIG